MPAAKVSTIHNGVDLARFGAGRATRGARCRWTCPPRPVVGTVGRLDPVKDQAGLVRAFATVLARAPGGAARHRRRRAVPGGARARLVADLGRGDHVRLLGEPRRRAGGAGRARRVRAAVDRGGDVQHDPGGDGEPACRWWPPGSAAIRSSSRTESAGALVPRQDPAALAAAHRGLRGRPAPARDATERPPASARSEHFSLERMAEAYADLYTRPGGRPPGEERLSHVRHQRSRLHGSRAPGGPRAAASHDHACWPTAGRTRTASSGARARRSGHRRLSIIDLSTGDQPIYNEDRTQGRGLQRRDLQLPGAAGRARCSAGTASPPPRTPRSSSTRWEEYGDGCVARLRGHVRLRALGPPRAPPAPRARSRGQEAALLRPRRRAAPLRLRAEGAARRSVGEARA